MLWRRHPDLNRGIKVLQTLTLPLGYSAINYNWSGRRDSNSRRSPWQGDALPLSHSRNIWWLDQESNQGHEDFQSSALPTELTGHITRRRPTLPQGYPCSTIGALRLNHRVRNGNGCYPQSHNHQIERNLVGLV